MAFARKIQQENDEIGGCCACAPYAAALAKSGGCWEFKRLYMERN